MRLALGLMMVVLAFGPASGQPAPPPAPEVETVVVQGQRLPVDDTARNFVMNFAARSPVGQLPLWRTGICVKVFGLAPPQAIYVGSRVKEIAQQAGAPVDRRDPCRTNLMVTFTREPQAFLDQIRNTEPDLVGYKRTARITHPIQVLYVTNTVDNKGRRRLDDPFEQGWDNTVASEGRLLKTGLSSEFHAVTVIVDSNRIQGQQIGALADYIAMLALSQTRTYDRCQEVPSVANLLLPACDSTVKASALTPVDAAFLKGLYGAKRPNGMEALQQGRIVSAMKESLSEAAR